MLADSHLLFIANCMGGSNEPLREQTDVAAVNDAAPEVMFPNCTRVGMLQERLEYRSSFSKSRRTALAKEKASGRVTMS